jgi:uncharacterized protein
MSSSTQREPLHFGALAEPLFGCYHAASIRRLGAPAVLLCHPFGQEYIRSHRALSRLADMLAEAGLPTLRFDQYGCGDSPGDTEAGTVDRWVADIALAAAELRRRSGSKAIAVVGLRFGATLAWLASRRLGIVESMVLWQPVTDGRAYLSELAVRHRRMLRLTYTSSSRNHPQTGEELFGFPITADMRRDMERIALSSAQTPEVDRVLLVDREHDASAALRVRLTQSVRAITHHPLTEHQEWLGRLTEGLVPIRLLESIVQWLAPPTAPRRS